MPPTPSSPSSARRPREERPRARPGRGARRRDRQHRRDGRLSRHGHRYREAAGRRAARDPAPPARPARRLRAADGRGVPGVGAGGDRRPCAPAARVPVLVGGSALYTRAVLDQFEFPGTDEAVRGRLEAELDDVRARPPCTHDWPRSTRIAAGDILLDNGRRIVRALEVVEITGRPFSATLPRLVYADPHAVQIGVDIDRPDPRRPDRAPGRGMLEAGFVAEVERLLAAGLREGGRPAGRSATARCGVPRRRADARRGARADRDRDPAVRPPAGLVVPQGPPHRLGAVRRPATCRAGLAPWDDGRVGNRWLASRS